MRERQNTVTVQSGMHGFTLLELLVVITIIGILAAVILAALGSARLKAADAAIKDNLKNAHSQGQVYYDLGSETFAGVCALSGTRVVGPMVKSAEINYSSTVSTYALGTASTWNTAQCHESATAWAAEVPLKASASGAIVAWCVDSTGASRQVNAALGINATVCP